MNKLIDSHSIDVLREEDRSSNKFYIVRLRRCINHNHPSPREGVGVEYQINKVTREYKNVIV